MMQQYQDGQTVTIGGKTLKRVNGRWVPADTANAPIYGVAPKVDPYKEEDQRLQREAAARAADAADRAANADQRAAAAAERAAAQVGQPTLSAGYRWKDGVVGGVAEPIPVVGADGQPLVRYKPLPEGARQKLESEVGIYGTLKQSLNTFQPDYGGNVLGGLENKVQGIVGDSVGTPGQRNWWARFKAMDNVVRNELFGATLTPSEQAAYEATTISPYLDPDVLKQNLAARTEIVRKALARKSNTFKANKFEPEAIDATLGEYGPDVYSPGPVFTPDGALAADAANSIGQRLNPEQKAEFTRILQTQGPAAADEFLRPLNMKLRDPEEAAKYRGPPDVTYDDRGLPAAGPPEDEPPTPPPGSVAEAGADDLIKQGMMFGLGDEAAGVGSAAANILTSPFTGRFDPIGAYQRGNRAEDARLDRARRALGWGGTIAEGAGLVAQGLPRAVAALPTLAGRMWQNAKTGGGVSALAGFGYGEGLEGSLTGGALAGLGGMAAGAAFPVVTTSVGNALSGVRDMIGKGRPGLIAARNIRNALDADQVNLVDAGRSMDAKRALGVPGMLADEGENLTNLLGSVTRQPGASRRVAKKALTDRQNEQGERIEAAITRDLGPIGDPYRISNELAEQASTTAAPLYDAFRAAPGASAVRLDDLMTRPSFREGLKKAAALAAERGDDPRTLGFDLDDAGEVVLTKVPSWQTLDYIKQGMDDVVYANKNPLTGAPTKTNKTSSVANTRRMLVARMDAVNPHYAPARAAYAGPTAAAEALEKGLKAVNKSADDINASVAKMTPFELEHYQLGLRKAMADLVASRSDTGDKVTALIGTRKKRAALARVFGGKAEFDRFMQTLDAEGAAQTTYNRALTGSPTALNQAVDELTSDAGLLQEAAGAVIRGGQNGGLWGSIVSLASRLRDAEKFGSGRVGEDARESIAALLTQTDPVELKAVMDMVQRLRSGDGRRAMIDNRASSYVGSGLGAGMGASQQPSLEPR